MMTEAPDMKPEMTEWDKKFVSQPSFKIPTIVYKHPARNATCKAPHLCTAHPSKFYFQNEA